MPQCGYSRRALGLIDQYRDEYETVDVLESLDEYRVALEEHSGWETIPQTFVDGEFVGGSDILVELGARRTGRDARRRVTIRAVAVSRARRKAPRAAVLNLSGERTRS